MGIIRRARRRRHGSGVRPVHVLLLTITSNIISFPLGLVSNAASSELPHWVNRWAWPLFGATGIASFAVVSWLAILSLRSEGRPEERKRRDRLQMTRNVEAKMQDRLKYALTDVQILSLSLVARPELLRSLSERKVPQVRSSEATRHREDIDELFAQRAKSLLILGEGGSGKSVLLVQLCQKLCTAALANDPDPVIPIHLNLADWSEKDSDLEGWLCRAVPRTYVSPSPGNVRGWIDDGAILPILDGINEIEAKLRPAAIRAINKYIRDGPRPIAVSCRTREYLAAKTPLEVSYAVEIEPLAHADVIQALQNRPSPVIDAVLNFPQQDQAWWNVLSTPLMLGVISQLSVRTPDAALRKTGSAKQRKEELLDRYISTLAAGIDKPQGKYSPEKVVQWLAWLANWMTSYREQEFSYDRIFPTTVLPQRDALRVMTASTRMGMWIIKYSICIIGILLFFLIHKFSPIRHEYAVILLQWIGCVALTFATQGRVLKDYNIGRYSIQYPTAKLPNLRKVSIFLIRAISISAAFGLIIQSTHMFHYSISDTIAICTLVAVAQIPFLIDGTKAATTPYDSNVEPGMLLKQAHTRAKWAAISTIPMTAASATAASFLTHSILSVMPVFVGYGGVTAISYWVAFGGAPIVQHHLLGREMGRRGYGPSDYAKFLAWAADRLLLHPTGGLYAFPHPDIQDHLARQWRSLVRESLAPEWKPIPLKSFQRIKELDGDEENRKSAIREWREQAQLFQSNFDDTDGR